MVFWLPLFNLSTYRTLYIYITHSDLLLSVNGALLLCPALPPSRRPKIRQQRARIHAVEVTASHRAIGGAWTRSLKAFFVSSPSMERHHHPSHATALQAWEKNQRGKWRSPCLLPQKPTNRHKVKAVLRSQSFSFLSFLAPTMSFCLKTLLEKDCAAPICNKYAT